MASWLLVAHCASFTTTNCPIHNNRIQFSIFASETIIFCRLLAHVTLHSFLTHPQLPVRQRGSHTEQQIMAFFVANNDYAFVSLVCAVCARPRTFVGRSISAFDRFDTLFPPFTLTSLIHLFLLPTLCGSASFSVSRTVFILLLPLSFLYSLHNVLSPLVHVYVLTPSFEKSVFRPCQADFGPKNRTLKGRGPHNKSCPILWVQTVTPPRCVRRMMERVSGLEAAAGA
jgi:hypothetical protein